MDCIDRCLKSYDLKYIEKIGYFDTFDDLPANCDYDDQFLDYFDSQPQAVHYVMISMATKYEHDLEYEKKEICCEMYKFSNKLYLDDFYCCNEYEDLRDEFCTKSNKITRDEMKIHLNA